MFAFRVGEGEERRGRNAGGVQLGLRGGRFWHWQRVLLVNTARKEKYELLVLVTDERE